VNTDDRDLGDRLNELAMYQEWADRMRRVLKEYDMVVCLCMDGETGNAIDSFPYQDWLDLQAEVERLQERIAQLDVMVAVACGDANHFEGEVERLRMALKAIQDWDCLNPPNPALCHDHPWLRQLVDDALGEQS
jgi:hypothetical protein